MFEDGWGRETNMAPFHSNPNTYYLLLLLLQKILLSIYRDNTKHLPWKIRNKIKFSLFFLNENKKKMSKLVLQQHS